MDRFTDNNDGTITDNETGLMWEKGPGPELAWQTAIDRCRDLRLAGYDDWRMPTVEALLTIVDYSFCNPICDPIFEAQPGCYWSATTPQDYPPYAWFVFFGSGFVDRLDVPNTSYVRAVRGGLTIRPFGISTISTGWICPRCGGGVAPTAITCPCTTTPSVTI